ncbi:FtsX-like permease family protein [Cellulomonas sp.]|uniref:FtsX-like permease family protein n=1 Tax=Cellulomonas sp. TaxID=40001 RepID=UPI002811C50E|nr:FtsX-like permease family protein [Cellulomonas sp.]
MTASTALRTSARATTAGASLVTRRRAAQDRALLVGSAVLLLGTLVLALALPRLVERAGDLGVRGAVENAGTTADVVAVPTLPTTGMSLGAGSVVQESAEFLMDSFGDRIGVPVLTVRSSAFTARLPSGTFAARVGVVATVGDGDRPQDAVRWVAGQEPRPVPDTEQAGPTLPDLVPRVEVGMAAESAQRLGVTLDAGPLVISRGTNDVGGEAQYVVTGLYEPVDPGSVLWREAPWLVSPVAASGTRVDRGEVHGLLVPPDNAPDLQRVIPTAVLQAAVRAQVQTADLTLQDARAMRRDVVALAATSGGLASDLPAVVDAFETRLVAARAQASLVVVGVAATGALCLVLAAGLLVERRRAFLAAERARGASLASVVLRALVETVPVALAVGGVAYGAVDWALGAYRGTTAVAVAVAVAAALAPPVLAARAASAAWAGRRVPADRRERARLAAQRGARRLAGEALVVVLAVAALTSVRTRGLVPVAAGEVDPLLAAAPVLVAAAASLVVVRVAPALVRVAGRLAARSRGIAAPLAAARAQGAATAVVPLLTVTVAVALVVLSGTLAQSVRTGQVEAADRLVGADARLDGALDRPVGRAALAALRGADGVAAVAAGSQLTDRRFGEGTGLSVTLLVVDTAELAAARTARGLPVDAGLAGLAQEEAADGQVPALVSAQLLDRLAENGVTGPPDVSYLRERVVLDVRGTTTLSADAGAPPLDARAAVPVGETDDGVVVLDRSTLAATGVELPATDRAWVAGPGAAEAVAALGLAAPTWSGVTVTTRDGWWRAWSAEPLTGALLGLQSLGIVVLVALLVLALVLVVVATARERGRTLSTLRTLGLDAGAARAATLGELAPLVLGGFLGGTAIGLVVPLLVTDTLGLESLTGGPAARTVPALWSVSVAGGALLVALVVAVAVEQAVRRRDRLGEVLRVGER